MTNFEIDNSLDFLNLCNKMNKPLWLRIVIVPTINDNEEYIKELEKKYENYNLPEEMGLKKIEFEGMEVYSYNDKPKNKKILLYIHGGSYIEEANYFQIDFAMKVCYNQKVRVDTYRGGNQP